MDNRINRFIHEIQGDTVVQVNVWRWMDVDEI